MSAAKTAAPGDIMQINPASLNRVFAGCMLVVTEVKAWGVQGYVQALGGVGKEAPGGQAHVRITWAEFEPTGGRAVWNLARDEEA